MPGMNRYCVFLASLNSGIGTQGFGSSPAGPDTPADAPGRSALTSHPASSCHMGSGLPIPLSGSRCVSRIRRITRRASARSCSTHQARSSKPAGSNSKLLNRRLEWDSFLASLRSQKALLHSSGPQEVCGFPLGFYLMPELDWHDDGCWLTTLVGNDLDFRARHNYKFTLPSTYACIRGGTQIAKRCHAPQNRRWSFARPSCILAGLKKTVQNRTVTWGLK
jgi:hypothetical protein